MKERNDQGRECGGTGRRQSGGTEEEGKVGNAHERERALRRKERWEEIKSGGKDDWRGREQSERERERERERARESERERERERGGGCGFPS